METAPPIKEFCASCGMELSGKYCSQCGEKKIIPELDFHLAKFFKQAFSALINFDSKLIRSCWYLFSKPGFLTAEWIAGRRVRYFNPAQMFVVVSVLFYFFLPTTTAYFTGYRDLVKGHQSHNLAMNIFQYDFEGTLIAKSIERGIDQETLKNQFTEKAAQRSKTWLFLIIPLWGSVIYLVFRSKIPWLAPNLVFALHGLSFYILFDLSIHAFTFVLGINDIGRHIFLMLLMVFPVYLSLAARRVYGNSWPLTIAKTLIIFIGFVVLILFYRQIVSISAITTL